MLVLAREVLLEARLLISKLPLAGAQDHPGDRALALAGGLDPRVAGTSTGGLTARTGSSPASASASSRARSSASASSRARSSAPSSRWGSIAIGSSSAPGGLSLAFGCSAARTRRAQRRRTRRAQRRALGGLLGLRLLALGLLGLAIASALAGARLGLLLSGCSAAGVGLGRRLFGVLRRGVLRVRSGVSSRRLGRLVGHRIDLHRLRLLGLVRVLGAGVDLELPQLLAREAVTGEHPLDRLADHLLGSALEHLAEGPRAQPAGVAAVAVVDLVLELVPGHRDLLRIDHDHEVTGVAVRRVLRLALAAQRVGDLGRQAAQRPALGVDQIPVALAVLGCCDDRSSSSADGASAHEAALRLLPTGAARG